MIATGALAIEVLGIVFTQNRSRLWHDGLRWLERDANTKADAVERDKKVGASEAGWRKAMVLGGNGSAVLD